MNSDDEKRLDEIRSALRNPHYSEVESWLLTKIDEQQKEIADIKEDLRKCIAGLPR